MYLRYQLLLVLLQDLAAILQCACSVSFILKLPHVLLELYYLGCSLHIEPDQTIYIGG